MSATSTTLFDSDEFNWHRSPNDPLHYFRKACGGEAFFKDKRNYVVNGEEILFVGITIRLDQPSSSTGFLQAARQAWLLLRRDVPTVAVTAENDEEGRSYVSYHVPESNASAVEWARRTVRVVRTAASMDRVRLELGKKQLPDQNNDQIFLYIIPRSHVKYDLLVHAHHMTLDGVGIMALLTLFLRKLAEVMENPGVVGKKFVWGSEAESLLPAFYDALAVDEPNSGPEFDKTFTEVISDMSQFFDRQRGFRLREITSSKPNNGRMEYRFTKDETATVLKNVRHLGFTINDWLHGALSLIAIEDNPPPEDDSIDADIVSYGLVNSRGRLASPYNGAQCYPGFCVALAIFRFPFSTARPAFEGESERERLVRAASVIKSLVQKQKSCPSLLAILPPLVETILRASDPSIPVPPSVCPQYVADGVIERHLDREYGRRNGKPIITVDDYFLSLNTDAFRPFFRAWTWRDQLVLSIDFNGSKIPAEDVHMIMEKWVEKARLLLKGDSS